MKRPIAGALVLAAAALAVTAGVVRGPSPDGATAASHREAALIALDPAADITDFFMFRSYEPGHENNVVLAMNVIPAQEPSAGPNYYNFDPNVRYSFTVDNNKDGEWDVEFDVQFRNEIRGVVEQLGLPLSYVAVPPITKLDGPGSEGLGLRQKYSVTMKERIGGLGGGVRRTELGTDFIAVPSNVGPRTMPDYADLARQGTYDLPGGVSVFAGQRQDPFYIDLGGVFDTLNLRRMPLPLLSPVEDATDGTNPFGVDMLAGFNVNTIAVEVPSATIAQGGSVLGAYASTSRPRATVRGPFGDRNSTPDVQVQRLANPLVNEVIIGTKDKDRWNSLDPRSERDFLGYYLNPRLATALELVYNVPTGCTPFGSPTCSKTNRDDLVNVLLKYGPDDANVSDLLRLNLGVSPTPLAAQKRLTILAGDMAGWPNGRRPRDDVTDIAIRVVGGPNYLAGRAGDGVNVDDAALTAEFPFLALPADGRNDVSGGQQTPHATPPTPSAATSTASSGSAVAPAAAPAQAAPATRVVSAKLVRKGAVRSVAVKVTSSRATAKVRVSLLDRRGRVLRSVVRTVATNRVATVPGLKVAKAVRSVGVRAA